MSKNLYIDLGANEGATVKDFLAHNPDWPVVAFEPTPDLAAKLREKYAAKANVTVIESAVSDVDGEALFYPGIDSNMSSTLVPGKRPAPVWRIDYDGGYMVKTIDFDKWLRANALDADRVVIKMDIEGSEYSVLEHMLKTGALLYVNELRVEWHWDRYPSIAKADHERIRAEVDKQTKLVNWT